MAPRVSIVVPIGWAIFEVGHDQLNLLQICWHPQPRRGFATLTSHRCRLKETLFLPGEHVA